MESMGQTIQPARSFGRNGLGPIRLCLIRLIGVTMSFRLSGY